MEIIIPSDDFPGLAEKLARYEQDYIVEVLELTRGNVAAASRLLKMSRPNILWKKLKRIGIEASDHYPDCPDCGVARGNVPGGLYGPRLRNSNKFGYLKCPICNEYFTRKNLKKLGEPEEESKSELEKIMKEKFGPGGIHKGKTVIGGFGQVLPKTKK